MAKKKGALQGTEFQRPPNLLVSHKEAEERINAQIQKGIEIKNIAINSQQALERAQNEYSKWNSFNAELLRRLFDTPELSNEYSSFFGGVYSMEPTFHEMVVDHLENVQSKINRLESIRERLPLYEAPTIQMSPEEKEGAELGNKIFIVHGRDEAAKEASARFLEKLGLQPIILHEQPNIGRTIIEKFEAYADVGYAIILLTPDDMGGLASEKPELNLRARQNVVFELGYFIGKLGRKRVCALYREDVELPSDFHGVLYVSLDNGDAWKFHLAKELKAIGFEIDLNKII